MADIVLTGAANWSTCKSGGPPAADDNIYLNGTFALTLDGADAATYTCNLIRACVSSSNLTGTSATIALGAGTTTCTLAANIWAGAVTLLTIASGKTVAMTGKTSTGGTVSIKYGILVSSGGTLSALGAAVGGSASGTYGVFNNGGTVGDVGTVTGGTATNAHGAYSTSGTWGTITSAVGSSTNLAHGLYLFLSAATTVTVTSTTAGMAGAYGVAYGNVAHSCIINGGAAGSVYVPSLQLASGVQLVTKDTAGTSDIPWSQQADIVAAANVRYGTARYVGDAGLGTMPSKRRKGALR